MSKRGMMQETVVQQQPVDDDNEGVLDASEQTNRPKDDALHQQRIEAWHPILHPVWVIVSLFYLGVIFVPVGLKLDSMQSEIVELKQVYDKYIPPSPTVTSNGTDAAEQKDEELLLCGIGNEYNAGKQCLLNFTAPERMDPPILIYYELQNFHQNHRKYVNSRDDFQLAGEAGGKDKVSRDRCLPLLQLGNQTLNPCGLIANTFFNDMFHLVDTNKNKQNYTMREDGIAWESDIQYLFNQPNGFIYERCPNQTGIDPDENVVANSTICDPNCCRGFTTVSQGGGQPQLWSCHLRGPYFNPADNTCYRYYYPNDNSTQYLYETYPDIISPLEGVTNEHFVVWMRVALQPTFRKLYGWIDTPIEKGDVLVFRITANYVVTRFRGAKALIVTTTNMFGGRNQYLGPTFVWVGIFCLIAGVFFTLKHTLRPRKLADRSYLHFKQD